MYNIGCQVQWGKKLMMKLVMSVVGGKKKIKPGVFSINKVSEGHPSL